jgi:hypothetical protein
VHAEYTRAALAVSARVWMQAQVSAVHLAWMEAAGGGPERAEVMRQATSGRHLCTDQALSAPWAHQTTVDQASRAVAPSSPFVWLARHLGAPTLEDLTPMGEMHALSTLSTLRLRGACESGLLT